MDREGKLLIGGKKSLGRNKAMALQGGIAFLERRERHAACHFVLAVEPFEADTQPVKQPVLVQESELAHVALLFHRLLVLATATVHFTTRQPDDHITFEAGAI